MTYDLPLVEKKVKPHQITTLHLVCALAYTGTGAIIAIYNYSIPLWGGALLALGLLLLLLTLFKNRWLTAPATNQPVRIAELCLSLVLAAYSFYKGWLFPAGIFSVLTLATVFAIFWERSALDGLFIHIDENGFHLPVTSRKRFLPWVDIEQVVLRFGILSVNGADNSMQQWSISENDIDPEIFEAFCLAQVATNRSKRRKDDW